MKNFTMLSVLLAVTQLWAQPNTEVYLVDIPNINGKTSLINPENISNNEGYDNQPSFLDDNTLLFSSTRNGQTDIAKYNIATGTVTWVSDTKVGSEYSPLKIPNKEAVSAIRLDTTGLQRLYTYDIKTGEWEELLKDLKVGYHVWYNDHIIVSSVLVNDRMDLVVSNLKDGSNYTFQKNVGRSLHKIPNSDLISYISKENPIWEIKSLQPVSGATKKITDLPKGTEDMCWMPDGTVLTAIGKSVMQFSPKTDKEWNRLSNFMEKEINNITRMAVNSDGSQLVFVAGESPEIIVQKQVDSFNNHDLEAFVSCFSKNVLVRNFPNDTLYIGDQKMTKNYERFLANNPDAKVKVLRRIMIGNKVIDQEMATFSGKTYNQAAIYVVENGSISSMTFIHEKEKLPEAVKIVQKQLDAYNARDIDAFLDTYSDDIKVYNFPEDFSYEGKEKMREGYGKFFSSTPDLNCEIKNRMVIGNKIVDEEYLTVNGNNFSAVAIYEVKDGKIAKVTFLR